MEGMDDIYDATMHGMTILVEEEVVVNLMTTSVNPILL